MSSKISVVIPTYNRVGLLKKHLLMYNKQTLSEDFFEIVVVNDGGEEFDIFPSDYRFDIKLINQDNSGPATARNAGVKNSSGDIVLFVGDDCLPSKNLLFRHLYNHTRNAVKGVVQGYTPWHPVIYDPFITFLEKHSLQVNWSNIKNKDGSWMYQINPGYCVTTNYSIEKSLFELMNGFDEDFKAAAWEDIEFGFRAMKVGFPHFFDSGATNYHYHHYDVDSFAQRQQTEGFWRVLLCMKQSDFVEGLLNPEHLRQKPLLLRDIDKPIFRMHGIDIRVDEIVEEDMLKYMMANSIIGTEKGLNSFDEKLNYVLLAQNPEIARKMIFAVDSILRGDNGFALHCCQWLLEAENSVTIHQFCRDIKKSIYEKDNREIMFHDIAIAQLRESGQ